MIEEPLRRNEDDGESFAVGDDPDAKLNYGSLSKLRKAHEERVRRAETRRGKHLGA